MEKGLWSQERPRPPGRGRDNVLSFLDTISKSQLEEESDAENSPLSLKPALGGSYKPRSGPPPNAHQGRLYVESRVYLGPSFGSTKVSLSLHNTTPNISPIYLLSHSNFRSVRVRVRVRVRVCIKAQLEGLWLQKVCGSLC